MSKKAIIILFIVSLSLGFLSSRQFFLSQQIKSKVSPENNQALAYEVSELFKGNNKLKEEVSKLNEDLGKLNQTSANSKEVDQTLSDKIVNYKIISGAADIQGQGVIIRFEKKVYFTQIVDLVNAIKNIGVEAISIDDTRLLVSSYIAPGFFPPGLTIKAIGNKELLYESLTRSGGIISQISDGIVTKEDAVVIPSV